MRRSGCRCTWRPKPTRAYWSSTLILILMSPAAITASSAPIRGLRVWWKNSSRRPRPSADSAAPAIIMRCPLAGMAFCMPDFKLVCDYKPRGDQGTAIDSLTRGVFDAEKHQVLLGVTGSGKTFTMAKLIENANRPALVLAHNKTLAAQLYHEFKSFFPHNAVEYSVSYYDYYQPEAYVPAADLYIEKEATINDELDKLRLSATRSLFERRDCLIVAS